MSGVYIPGKDMQTSCTSCTHVRMRRDICGIYCELNISMHDEICAYYKNYKEVRKEKRNDRKEKT